MKNQMTIIAAMIIFAMGLLTSAAAQDGMNDGTTRNIFLTGIETATGTFEPTTEMFYGNNFVLNSLAGRETYHLTIALDYRCEQCGMNNHFPVTGGSWTMIVFRNNVYLGTLYGNVSGGTIDLVRNRNGEPGFSQMRINLKGVGGLDGYAERGGVDITGIYEAITDARSKQTTGSINFTD